MQILSLDNMKFTRLSKHDVNLWPVKKLYLTIELI